MKVLLNKFKLQYMERLSPLLNHSYLCRTIFIEAIKSTLFEKKTLFSRPLKMKMILLT